MNAANVCPSYENRRAELLGPTPSLHSAPCTEPLASSAPAAHALLLTDNSQSALTGGVLLIGALACFLSA